MIVLSAACMAECKYCFGPHEGKLINKKTVNQTIQFIEKSIKETGQKKVCISFHGGEPLLAPFKLWEYTLNRLKSKIKKIELNLSIQSNLWNLNNDFCKLFKEYNVSVGTSIDGPKEINDRQRGEGYFDKTFQGIKIAEDNGLDVGCISTFTPFSHGRWKEVFDFFLNNKLSFSIHPSLKPMNLFGNDELFLNNEQYGNLLSDVIIEYLTKRKHIQIGSFDQFCRSVAFGMGEVCTFKDCFGMFLAIDPEGDIYSCQRFIGHKSFNLGNISELPDLTSIENHKNAKALINRGKKVKKACNDCEHLNYCRGGCYYNAVSGGNGVIDPYCNAYKKTFDLIKGMLLNEIRSKENVEAMQTSKTKDYKKIHLQRGKIISLTKEKHPSLVGQNAKMTIALHEIAKDTNLEACAHRMVKEGFTFNKDRIFKALKQIKKSRCIRFESNDFYNINKIEKIGSNNNFILQKCKDCDFRYLCEGISNIQSKKNYKNQLETLSKECESFMNSAIEKVQTAKEYLLNDDI